MKLCRCGAKIPYASKACEKCLPIVEQQKKERYKTYAKQRQDKDIQRIYNSGNWEKVKNAVKARQNGMCLYSYYLYGEIKPIEIDHHIIETKEDISKAFISDNVIGVTDVAHKHIHREYLKGKREKKVMQEVLLGLIKRYEEEFK